jgi:hypothetical protein
MFNFPFEVEHIRPIAKGGKADLANLGLACRSCNIYKSLQTLSNDPETGELIPLFDPSRSAWDQHFFRREGFIIAGLTTGGRATVELLRMNSPRQLAAREQ